MRRFYCLFVVFCLFAALAGCNSPQPLSETRFLLDTVCTITLYEPKEPALLARCFERGQTLESLLSHTIPGSEFSGLDAKSYTVQAVAERNAKSDAMKASYLVLDKPEASFANVVPDEMEIPSPAPSVTVRWNITGYGVNAAAGVTRITGTSRTANAIQV